MHRPDTKRAAAAGDMAGTGRTGRGATAWLAYAACAWGLLFAILHVYWALGGRAGLGDAPDITERTWFLLYDVVAGILSLVVAAVALALVQLWGRLVPRRLLLLAAWAAGVLLALRGLIGVVQLSLIALGIISEPDDMTALQIAIEPWFLLGGMLFALLAWFGRRRPLA